MFALAAYVLSLKGGPRPPAEQESRTAEATAFAAKVEWGHPENPPVPDDPVMRQGAKVFETQCATCHRAGSNPAPLALTTIVNATDAENLVRVVFQGIQPPRGVLDRSMPGRAIQISDEEMVALATFVRARFSRQPAWTEVGEIVRKTRGERP